MNTKTWLHLCVIAAAGLVAGLVQLNAQPGVPPSVTVGAGELGGAVTGPNGPEAGVWVIAETTDLPTKFAKIVVTDDQGRYLIPDLPKANYDIWVRGYGLVDSPKTRTEPGKVVNLTAVPAPDAAVAAQIYPPIYWFSMLHVPRKDEFPLPKIKSQGEWLNIVKSGACQSCHPLGTPGMRTISKELGEFKNSAEAWQRRLMSGSAQMFMARDIGRLDTQHALELFGDWTDRVAAGELPFAKPQRPRGIERNAVITLWDWSHPTAYLHDAISTDRRNPRVNANGKIYGSPEDSTDFVPILDPVTNTASEVKHPVRDPKTPNSKDNPFAPSPYWGAQPIWDSQTINHNPMMDEKGRVWFTPRIRPHADPDFCKQGSKPSLRQGVPVAGGRPPPVDVRPDDRKVHADRHLLSHPSSQLRARRKSDAVGECRRGRSWRHRLVEPENVRGDRRRGEVAGLDAVHSRHQRQRQARRLCGARPARSIPTKDKRVVVNHLCGRPSVRPMARCGAPSWAIRALSCA